MLGWAGPVVAGIVARILPSDFGRSELAHILTLNNEGGRHSTSGHFLLWVKRLDHPWIAAHPLP
ncbi:MAG: hypothetical protein CMM01_14110 [Rhodopirellula sp.]|nr:hypothetical protein [Rhodopirellula sp.]